MPGDSSSTPSAVAVPTAAGEPQPGSAVGATPMKGGMLLSPLPLTGGKKTRGTRRISKKMLKMLKKNPKLMKKLASMKGGEEEVVPAGGKKRSSTRRGSKKSRSGLLY